MGKGIEGPRAEVTVWAARLLVALRPRAWLLENAATLLARARPGGAWRRAEAILVRGGFVLRSTLVEAGDLGVGQSRIRTWVVGVLDGSGAFCDAFVRGLDCFTALGPRPRGLAGPSVIAAARSRPSKSSPKLA